MRRWKAAASAVWGTAGYSSCRMGPAGTDMPTPTGSASTMASFRAEAAFLAAASSRPAAMAAPMDGTRLMLRGYIKEAGRANRVMPKVYSP